MPAWPEQVNRSRRDHDFYPDAAVLAQQSGPIDASPNGSTTVIARYHLGQTQWWLAAVDPGTSDALVCVTEGTTARWHQINLAELERAFVVDLGGVVLRDPVWQPRSVADIHALGNLLAATRREN